MASCKITVIPVYSPNSDYDPNLCVLQDYDEVLSSPTRKVGPSIVSVATSSTSLVAANVFASTFQVFYLKNLDGTNFVTVTLTSGSGSDTIKVPAGRSMLIPQVDPTVAVTAAADTAACLCEIFAAGA